MTLFNEDAYLKNIANLPYGPKTANEQTKLTHKYNYKKKIIVADVLSNTSWAFDQLWNC